MSSKIFDEYLKQARALVKEVQVEEAKFLLDKLTPFFDVREESEIEQGQIRDAHTPGRSFLESAITERIPQFDMPIVLYCASGTRSLVAGASLSALGYVNVMSITGGLAAWKAAGYPVEKRSLLSSEERKRYGRQIILPQVGPQGQAKLREARVVVIGAGGLGAPSLMYLAAAGVGHIGVVDHDSVDLGNLHRQIIYRTADVGEFKASASRNTLLEMNPQVKVSEFRVKLDESSAHRILSDFDVVVDCTDNFSARYLINDTALELGLPVVHGSVFQFEGQVALLNYRNGPCYRCLFPEPPPPEVAPSCSEAGVLGVVPGLIGVLQATVVIKLILGLEIDNASATVYHGLDDGFSRRKLRKRDGCMCAMHRETCFPMSTSPQFGRESR
ncbi:ThiF family adenylyltransferase [Caballeronia sp. LZ043]|uniref:ThiF family adenylyltransferase n=1 Tax=Caballeronia sp. LZ043 TaxID=3038569 RepID=UPI0028542D7F|nr:ThiF family adenylyltransferase [Caballeronia sp. LZ043]MDR5822808.1 ThiF family adenylyltransferase [Caballeronia sp. LZ043]